MSIINLIIGIGCSYVGIERFYRTHHPIWILAELVGISNIVVGVA